MIDMRQMMFDWFGNSEPSSTAAHEERGEASQTPGKPQPPADRESGPYVPAEPIADVIAPVQFSHPRANRAITFDKAHVAYEFRRGKRKTIGFTVNAEGLVVSAPKWTTLSELDAVLREKERWIIAKLGEVRGRHERLESSRIDWKEGAVFPFLGTEVVLALDPRQRHGKAGAVLETPADPSTGAAPLTLHLGLPRTATPEQLRDTTQAWLMRQARRVFTSRLDHFAPELGVTWQRLSLSSAATRWGSASADGSIRLNWRLIHFREPIIDYVVVHELAHLREMNHSPRFWAHVENILPDYADRKQKLKDEAIPKW